MFATLFFTLVLAAGNAPQEPKPDPGFTPDPAWKPLGKDNKLWFDPIKKRIVLRQNLGPGRTTRTPDVPGSNQGTRGHSRHRGRS